MKQEIMTISKQRQLAPRIFEMTLTGELVNEMRTPGQFLHLRVLQNAFLLRRPISINHIDAEKKNAESFIGSKEMAQEFFQK